MFSNNRRKLLLIPFILVLIVVAVGIIMLLRSDDELIQRPLVLISSPYNHDQVEIGEVVSILATARSQQSLARLELWINDVLIAQEEPPTQDPANTLVLSLGWTPFDAGRHRLVARTITIDGIESQSSITINAVDSGTVEELSYLVGEGDTIESIALDFGISTDALSEANPGLGEGEPNPGDQLTLPDEAADGSGEEPGERQPLPETDSDPPGPQGDSPSGDGAFGDMGGEGISHTIGLRLEVVALMTAETYEGLHCYLSLAHETAQWIPDQDGDPTTDESFGLLGPTADGSIAWDVSRAISGTSTPVIFWPSEQNLPLSSNCVGITQGGTQALSLGELELSIPPSYWDSVIHIASVEGPEGSYQIGYRVSYVDAENPTYFELDPDMTPPTNLRTTSYNAILGPSNPGNSDEPVSSFFVTPGDPIALLWEYNPQPDEEPIAGFRIYLNGNLQWTEGLDRRLGDNYYTVLPVEWSFPPCGEEYTITVSAWRPGGEDGFESTPAAPPIRYSTAADDCLRRLNIQLLTLETFDLGGDGRYDHRTGDVGPPWGSFYANDQVVTFDTGSARADLYPQGFNHNTVYNLSQLRPNDWNLSDLLRFQVELDEYNTAVLGFEIWDEDTGSCDEPGDPGCDDLICSGQGYVYDDGRPGESEIWADNRRCKITFSFEPALGSPGITRSYASVPQPSLWIEDLTLPSEFESDFVITNHGDAAWSYHNLVIQVSHRDGTVLDQITLEELFLEPGGNYEVEYTSPGVPAVNVCFTLDPDNLVTQAGDTAEASSVRVCPGYPDLSIEEVMVDPETGHVSVRVLNNGSAPIQGTDLVVALESRDYEGMGQFTWPDSTLAAEDSIVLEQEGMNVLPPYDVCAVIDPDDTIDEINEYNQRRCTGLPDLVIDTVHYIGLEGGGGELRVYVRNDYEAMSHGSFRIQVFNGDGRETSVEAEFEDVNLGRNETQRFLVPVPAGLSHVRQYGDYTVTVNPEGARRLVEARYDNNEYYVMGVRRLQLWWCTRNIPNLSTFSSAVTMHFTAEVVTDVNVEYVVDETWESETEVASQSAHHLNNDAFSTGVGFCNPVGVQDNFAIRGDEWLHVRLSATYRDGSVGDYQPIGSSDLYFDPNNHWEAGSMPGQLEPTGTSSTCYHTGGGHFVRVPFRLEGALSGSSWFSWFLVCDVTPEE